MNYSNWTEENRMKKTELFETIINHICTLITSLVPVVVDDVVQDQGKSISQHWDQSEEPQFLQVNLLTTDDIVCYLLAQSLVVCRANGVVYKQSWEHKRFSINS